MYSPESKERLEFVGNCLEESSKELLELQKPGSSDGTSSIHP